MVTVQLAKSALSLFNGTRLNMVHVRPSSGRGNGVDDPGTAAVAVPHLQPANCSGPGSAPQRPPEAAAGAAAGHPAHHLATAGLTWYHYHQPLARQHEPNH